MQYEQLGNQIVSALTGAPAPTYGNAMNQGYPQQGTMMNQGYPQQGNMMNQGYPQQGNMMNQGYPQQGNMNQGYPQQGYGANRTQERTGDSWVCSCGARNTGIFCEYCGAPKP